MIDRPLQVSIEDCELVIRIGLNTLKHSAEHCPRLYNEDEHRGSMGPYVKVVDELVLAADVWRELLREKEDGSSPLSDLFDDAIVAALEDGSLAF
jgi:hypothetical protein